MKIYDVVILTDRNYLNFKEDDKLIQNAIKEDNYVKIALENLGLKVARLSWDNSDFDWSSAKAILFRTTWDYAVRFPEFSNWLNTYPNSNIYQDVLDHKDSLELDLAIAEESENAIDYFIETYAISQFHLASQQYPSVRIRGRLPITMNLGIAVTKQSPLLLSVLNKWIDHMSLERRYELAENWYLENAYYFARTKIDWISEYEYKLTIIDLEKKGVPFKVGSELTSKITKVEKDEYFYTSFFRNKTAKGSFKKVN